MAAPSDLKDRLRAIISEVSEVDTVPDAAMFKDLGIDSMMAIEIIAEIERTFKITVPEDELKKLVNFNAVYELVESKLSA